jgi:large subunit ribosomal protein L4
MAKVDVYNIEGEVIDSIELNDDIFGITVNTHVMHEAVLNQQANKRQGTQSAKTKSEVRGGGRKPWRQKGTGRARQGSIRSAQWIKGGVIFAPKPRDYSYSLPRKVRTLALKSAFSSKVMDNNIIVLDSMDFLKPKTKEAVKMLKNLNIDTTALILIKEKDDNATRPIRNIEGVRTSFVNTINVLDIMSYDKLIITKDAIARIEEVYAK